MPTTQLMAGRELDAHVAQEVLGYTLAPWGNEGELRRVHEHKRKSYSVLASYSTDIAAAWWVVEAMRKRGIYIDVKACRSGFRAVASRAGDVDAGEDFYEWLQQADAPTAPLAICRAAVAAVESR